MKKIKIQEITGPDRSSFLSSQRKYQVYLGNNTNYLFSNRKAAEKFIVETNRFLNLQLFELNHILIQVRTLYQGNWFCFDNSETLIRIEHKIIEKFFQIDQNMQYMVTSWKTPNYNYRVFKWFLLNIRNMSDVLSLLKTLQVRRNNYSDVSQAVIIMDRLDILEQRIEQYGMDNSCFIAGNMLGVRRGNYDLK